MKALSIEERKAPGYKGYMKVELTEEEFNSLLDSTEFDFIESLPVQAQGHDFIVKGCRCVSFTENINSILPKFSVEYTFNDIEDVSNNAAY